MLRTLYGKLTLALVLLLGIIGALYILVTLVTTRVFLHEDIYQAFCERLLERVAANIIAGDPMHPDTNFGALISALDERAGMLQFLFSCLSRDFGPTVI